MTKKIKLSRFDQAMLETAEGMHRSGIMDDESYRKITIRHLGIDPMPASKPVSGEEIRSLRESADLSQAAFARCLNLTPGYVSQLERGVKQPKGPALALFNILKKTGMDAAM
jgi:putative transcriptional regulator